MRARSTRVAGRRSSSVDRPVAPSGAVGVSASVGAGGRAMSSSRASTRKPTRVSAVTSASVVWAGLDLCEAVAVTRRAATLRHAAVDVQARDLAELAFVRAESIDVAVSVGALAAVADLLRVFRQVHRVLRVEGTVVMSVPHPILGCLADVPRSSPDDIQLVRRYGAPVSVAQRSTPAHTTEALVTALTRVGFRVETLLELMARPPAPTNAATPTTPDGATGWSTLLERLPATLVLRARKTGL